MTVEKILKIIDEKILLASRRKKEYSDKYNELTSQLPDNDIILNSIRTCFNRWCAALDELESLKEQLQREG